MTVQKILITDPRIVFHLVHFRKGVHWGMPVNICVDCEAAGNEDLKYVHQGHSFEHWAQEHPLLLAKYEQLEREKGEKR